MFPIVLWLNDLLVYDREPGENFQHGPLYHIQTSLISLDFPMISYRAPRFQHRDLSPLGWRTGRCPLILKIIPLWIGYVKYVFPPSPSSTHFNAILEILGITQGLCYLHSRSPAVVHGDLRAVRVIYVRVLSLLIINTGKHFDWRRRHPSYSGLRISSKIR